MSAGRSSICAAGRRAIRWVLVEVTADTATGAVTRRTRRPARRDEQGRLIEAPRGGVTTDRPPGGIRLPAGLHRENSPSHEAAGRSMRWSWRGRLCGLVRRVPPVVSAPGYTLLPECSGRERAEPREPGRSRYGLVKTRTVDRPRVPLYRCPAAAAGGLAEASQQARDAGATKLASRPAGPPLPLQFEIVRVREEMAKPRSSRSGARRSSGTAHDGRRDRDRPAAG